MRTEVLDLNEREVEDMLRRNNFCHFACTLNDKPYVVPMNFAYEMPFIFVYTTAGMKSKILDMNPQVCLQVEEIVDRSDWRSLIVHGNAVRIIDPVERERIFKLILETNPTLMPAMSIRWTDNWIRENKEVVYRIDPTEKSGRSAAEGQYRGDIRTTNIGPPNLNTRNFSQPHSRRREQIRVARPTPPVNTAQSGWHNRCQLVCRNAPAFSAVLES